MRLSKREIVENHARLLEREAFYKKQGYNVHQRFPYRSSDILRFLRKRDCRVRTFTGCSQWVAVARPARP